MADDGQDDLADLRDLFENAPCGYISAVPDGTIVRVNHLVADWTGLSAGRPAAGTQSAASSVMVTAIDVFIRAVISGNARSITRKQIALFDGTLGCDAVRCGSC